MLFILFHSYIAATGGQNPQPFLGRKPADIDTTSGHDWTHDDKTDAYDECRSTCQMI